MFQVQGLLLVKDEWKQVEKVGFPDFLGARAQWKQQEKSHL